MEVIPHANILVRVLEKLANANHTAGFQRATDPQGLLLVPMILNGSLALYCLARSTGVQINAACMRKLSGAVMLASGTGLLFFTKGNFSIVIGACLLGGLVGYTVSWLTQRVSI